MATDKFRFLAIECEDLPDDSLLRILSGEFNLDQITTGMTTRQIMGVIKNAPSKLSPSVYAANAPALYAFRSGTLDVKAGLLEAAIPSACAATGSPTPGGIGQITIGYGYETPLNLWLLDYTSNPANKGDEFAVNQSGGMTPGPWTPLSAPGDTNNNVMPPFSQAQVGAANVAAFLRNCRNRALGNDGDFAFVTGNVVDATSAIHPVVLSLFYPDITADPTQINLITPIKVTGGANELTIRRDNPTSGTILYSGTPGGPASFSFSCADYNTDPQLYLYYIFSRNGGSDEIILPVVMIAQDNNAICNP